MSQVRAICEAAIREYGVPARIRTDNGAPFAGTGLLGLSKLSLGWMKLGIVHERIQAGRPQQNGRHERMHRTLKEDTTKPPAHRFAHSGAASITFATCSTMSDRMRA
ncbi:integrase core domain-containing protein [Tunturiibacter gelidiferens]|uniref:integrase core domain-containing protein n=1 Tax=Tunturiibacter gelidiferens TaxID=3069689 RepID=UPI003D9BA3EC